MKLFQKTSVAVALTVVMIRDRPGAGEQRSGGPSGCWA